MRILRQMAGLLRDIVARSKGPPAFEEALAIPLGRASQIRSLKQRQHGWKLSSMLRRYFIDHSQTASGRSMGRPYLDRRSGPRRVKLPVASSSLVRSSASLVSSSARCAVARHRAHHRARTPKVIWAAAAQKPRATRQCCPRSYGLNLRRILACLRKLMASVRLSSPAQPGFVTEDQVATLYQARPSAAYWRRVKMGTGNVSQKSHHR